MANKERFDRNNGERDHPKVEKKHKLVEPRLRKDGVSYVNIVKGRDQKMESQYM